MASVNPTNYDPNNPTGVANSTQNTTTYNNGVVVRNRASGVGVTPVAEPAAAPSGGTTEDLINQWRAARLKTEPTTPPTDDDGINPGSGSGGLGGSGGYRGGSGGGASGGYGGSYSAPRLPTATDQSAYINAMYAANEQAARDNLRAEYENNLAQLDYQQGRLPGTYDSAVDQANAQAAINRANFNEQAAASGLNTGAGSQVRLSQNNALLGNVSAIRKAQADAQAELDFQRTQMEQQYQQAIREAVAQNDLQRAQALYQEARRVDESIVNTAINQANLDWSVWRSLYR